jgi:voltage-gated potassium channel
MLKIYNILEGHSKRSQIINSSIAVLIVLNIVAVILDSYKSINNKYSVLFNYFETGSIVIFSIEYILRVISSPCRYDGKYNPLRIIKYLISPLAIIDLLSILPFYLPLIFKLDLRFIRITRVVRLIRILKIKRYSKSLDTIIRVFKSRKTDLVMTIFVIGILIILSGSLMYYLENEIQPELFPNIIDSALWSLKTMVFLGYENPPMSELGKLIGLLITFLGLGWIAMPISIISSGFVEEINKQKECKGVKCPHCGKEI